MTVREPADILRAQLAENTMRKDFLPSETYEIFKSLLPEEQAAAKERMRKGGRVRKLSLPCDQTGQTRDKIAAFTGVSGKTAEKIAAVCQAANLSLRNMPRLSPIWTEPAGSTASISGSK